ncbi:(Fe-S)-binding protein [Flavobacterium sp. GA093]|uniref:(Fe-S)-binding protein n=1 Tax=Flavobacterium hydrocarbonoxydans TaxID=2683249 RepID=A0A6I4NHE9_9FLAO|nr:(Fe-S)-binding protein [Flavobacterium hydrocarbonoxydans]MWB93896.1 (Fe-S)-binding protein [Flavobacterium hydrocarbonoxydans]
MTVALFIPCYIDQLYPKVGIATLELLEKLGCDVVFPLGQTCCGQPMANSGFSGLTNGCNKNFIANFSGFDYIVAPSGSCVLHLKEHLQDDKNPEKAHQIKNSLFELTEFLTDIIKVDTLDARFPFKVGIHNSCHGQRGLNLASMTEKNTPSFSKPEQLLKMVGGIELSYPKRKDECCGFGGTFCVFEEAVSVKMGKDRITEHEANDIDYITAGDSSCLMHLEGILNRKGSPIKTIHIAEILNSSF